jgi:hypothetical protein
MKTIKPTEFVRRAVSTDVGRYNMQSAWWEGSRVIGCDGYRLHWVEGLEPVEGYQYVDGIGEVPPNVNVVIKPLEPAVATWTPTRDEIKALKTLIKLIEPDRVRVSTLEIADRVQLLGPTDTLVQWHLPLTATPIRTEFRIGLQLRYLVDALIPGAYHYIHVGNGQIRVTYGGIYETYHALICQCQLDDCKHK